MIEFNDRLKDFDINVDSLALGWLKAIFLIGIP